MALIVEQALLPNISTSAPTTVPLTKFTGEVPKALIFMMGFPVGNDNGITLGFCTDPVLTPNWCAAGGNRDGASSTRTARHISSQRIGGLISNATGNWAQSAQVMSIGVNEFEMQGYGVQISGHPFLALGGSDLLNAKVVRWESDLDTPGIKSVTGAGFRPNFGLSVCSELTPGSENSGITAMSHNVFYWGPNTSVAASIGARNNQGTSGDSTSYMENTGVHIMSAASAIREVADPAVFTADGADLNYTAVRAGTPYLVYTLFLEFANDNVIVGSVQAPTTPGMVTDPLGFTGKGVLSLCCSQTGTNVQQQQHSRMMYGMMDDDDVQGGVALLGQDGVGTSNADASNDIYLSHGFNNVSDWTDDTDVAFGSFTGTDINFDWIAVNGTNRFRTAYIAFGEGGVPPTPQAFGTTTSRVDTQGDVVVTPPAIQAAGTTTSRVDTQGDVVVTWPVITTAGTTTSRVDTQGDVVVTPPVLQAAGSTTSRVNTLGDVTVTPPSSVAQGSTTSRVDTIGDVQVTPPGIPAAGATTSRVDTLGDITVTWPVVTAAGATTSRVDSLGDVVVTPPTGVAQGRTTSRVGTFGDILPAILGTGITTSRVDTLGDILPAAGAFGRTTSRVDTLGDIPTGDFAANPCRIAGIKTENRGATVAGENRRAGIPGGDRQVRPLP